MTRRAISPFSRLRDWVVGLGHEEIILLGLLLLVIGGIWSFVGLADEVLEGDADAFDVWILEHLRQPTDPAKTIGPAIVGEVALEITSLGSNAVLSLVTITVAGYLLLRRKFAAMWLVLVAVGGGAVASTILKLAFDRARPDVVPHLAPFRTSSFPSGHAMLAAVVWITLGALLASLEQRRVIKIYMLSVSLAIAMLVGVSRVFLGIHYPTDVLAGWCAGLSWAMLCWATSRWLQRKHVVSTDAPV